MLREEDFNNQVNIMTHSVAISLFPQPPLSSPNRLMSKVTTVAEVTVMRKLSNTGFHLPRLTKYYHC